MTKPNYTQVSNQFLDERMNNVTGNAVKVFLAITRKTIGYHKDTDAISYTQIKKITGIGSYSTITKAIQELLDKDLIKVTRTTGGTTVYDLNVTATETVVVGTTETVEDYSNNRKGTATETVVTKERVKETTQKKDTRVKTLIDTFFKTYQERTGRKPNVTGAWGANFKRLLVNNTEDEINAVIDYFFAYKDRTQFSLNTFVAKYDNLAPAAVKIGGNGQSGNYTDKNGNKYENGVKVGHFDGNRFIPIRTKETV